MDSSAKKLAVAEIAITVVQLSIHADVTRDGEVNFESTVDKRTWKWGSAASGGHGAILLVNNDQDGRRKKTAVDSDDSKINGPLDLADMSRIGLKMIGPQQLPEKYRLVLHTNDTTSKQIRVFEFSKGGRSSTELIGPKRSSKDITRLWRGKGRLQLAVEGIDYPDKGFSGSGYIHVSVVEVMYTHSASR